MASTSSLNEPKDPIVLRGLKDIAEIYDHFIVDLWGVVHNGVHVLDGVVSCLKEMKTRDKTVLFLSNAPRASGVVRDQLRAFGVDDSLYRDVVTSGDVTIAALRGLEAESYYHIGVAEKDSSLLVGIGMNPAPRMEDADVLIASNFMHNMPHVEDYIPNFDAAIAKQIPMYCANPDLSVCLGQNIVLCSGTLAKIYEERGGQVHYFGKPYAPVYDYLKSKYPSKNWLAVGDSLATDILGANQAGIDSLWVLSGIHKDADDAKRSKISHPTYILNGFFWS